jgi:hypothetical protein
LLALNVGYSHRTEMLVDGSVGGGIGFMDVRGLAIGTALVDLMFRSSGSVIIGAFSSKVIASTYATDW